MNKIFSNSTEAHARDVISRQRRASGAAEGEPCGGIAGVQCAAGLWCEYDNNLTAGICRRFN